MGNYVTKVRTNDVFKGDRGTFYWDGAPLSPAVLVQKWGSDFGYNTPYIGLGKQLTTSRSNSAPSIRAAVLGDRGGDFYTIDHTYSGTTGKAVLHWYMFDGYGLDPAFIYAKYCVFADNAYPASTASSVFGLDAAGTTAIARIDPTIPAASVSVALGELFRDGVPRLTGSILYKQQLIAYRKRLQMEKRNQRYKKRADPRSRKDKVKQNARKGASEYLNVEFGWKPLLSDVTKFATAVKESERILKQYHRNSGRQVRRRYYFPTEVTTSVEQYSTYPVGWFPVLSEGAYMPMATMTKTTTSTKKKWFSGAFTYHAAVGANDPLGKLTVHAQEANKLLGLAVTPETVWNLAPWSWAADWFGNMGDLAHNVSATMTDGLVLRYGYVMETTIDIVDYTMTNLVYHRGGSGPSELRQTFTTTVKQRRGCTPFGFGLAWAAMTPRQLAISTALGISESRRLGL